jgi:hypothetical protein
MLAKAREYQEHARECVYMAERNSAIRGAALSQPQLRVDRTKRGHRGKDVD